MGFQKQNLLKKPIKVKAVIPSFLLKIVLPIIAKFNEDVYDLVEMVNWIKSGAYVSKNTQRQKELFGDLPTIEEAVIRYCKDRNLISE